VDEPDSFGLTKAFTDRMNGYDSYEVPKLENAAYGDLCQPWGAVGGAFREPNDRDSGKLWSFVSDFLGLSDPRVDNASGLQCTTGSNYFAVSYDNAASTVNGTEVKGSRIANLRQLFRETFHSWNFIPGEFGTGFHYNDTIGDIYDDTPNVGEAISPFLQAKEGPSGPATTITDVDYDLPTVASVSNENCDSDGTCPAGAIGAISVNGRDEGVITVQNGSMNAVSKFYGWASHNAMPIVSRRMVWGDFSIAEAPSRGWYKNQKPYCAPGTREDQGVGECVGISGLTCVEDTDCPGSSTCHTEEKNHFGNTPGACAESPFTFQHVYSCTRADLDLMPACSDTDDDGYADNAPCYRSLDPDGNGPAASTDACVYRPGAQVKDNWGWCNCTGSDCDIGGGAYGDACDADLATGTLKPWTEFQGEIRIFPSPDEGRTSRPFHGLPYVPIPPQQILAF